MISKILVLCAALAAAHASIWGVPVISTGVSARTMKQDGMGNYAFGYDIVDGKGASNSRAEVGNAAGQVTGSYSLADTDGRVRKVEYVADGLGFRAAVKTNEPGTAMSAPAAAVIASPYAPPVAPVAAPVVAKVAAPVLAAAPLATLGHGAIIGGPLGLGLIGGIGKSIVW